MLIDEFIVLFCESAGLSADAVERSRISQSLERHMSLYGFSEQRLFFQWILQQPQQMSTLIKDLTAGKTWFFRENEAFTVLGQQMEKLLANQNQAKPLRIASMPCSSGEEAYSIAIALLEHGLSVEQFQVDAYDINESSVCQARRGVYPGSAFRGDTQRLYDSYINRHNDHYELSERVKKRVNFFHVNLLTLDSRSLYQQYDGVFCRNFLRYLNSKSRAEMANILRMALANHAVLIVASCEAKSVSQLGFSALSNDQPFAFSKPLSTGSSTQCAFSEPRQTVCSRSSGASEVLSSFSQAGDSQCSKQTQLKSVPVAQTVSVEDRLRSIEQWVDAAKWEEAEQECKRFLESFPNSVDAFFILGLIKEAVGELHCASEYFRKVLYLQPNHRDALLHSYAVCKRLGETENQQALLERLQRLR